jgi:hypothetical protein
MDTPERFPLFDRSRLTLLPLALREHDLDIGVVSPLVRVGVTLEGISETARALQRAKATGASAILMTGAHVLRSGMQRYLIDLMERGLVTCLAVNGACAIHDFEFSLIGKTTESVAKYIRDGQFGLWEELGYLNRIVAAGAAHGLGLGQAVGKAILEGDYPHKHASVFAAAYRLGVPITVHVGIGYDIVCEHPSYDGAAYGLTSYRDFLRFASVTRALEGGVIMNFGSAVMAPEVFLKALAMARNVAMKEGKTIRHFTSIVCDLHDFPSRVSNTPPKNTAAYFFRPWKTMLVRTVDDGGESWYIQGNHARTIPELWSALTPPPPE